MKGRRDETQDKTGETSVVDFVESGTGQVNLGPIGIGRTKVEWAPSRALIAILAVVLVVVAACMGIAWHVSHQVASSKTGISQSDVSTAENNTDKERRLALERERNRAESLIAEIEASTLADRVDCSALRELLRGTDPTALAAAADELRDDFNEALTMEIDRVGRLISQACGNDGKIGQSNGGESAELIDLRERWCAVRVNSNNFEDVDAAAQRMATLVDEITTRTARKTEQQQEETANGRTETNTEPSGEAQFDTQLVVPQQPVSPVPTVPQRPSWSVPDTDVSQLPQQDGSL